MRTKIIFEIFKKEMLDILRDKKSLFMMIVLPIILYPLILVGFSQILMMSMNSMESQEVIIAFDKDVNKELINRFSNYGSSDEDSDGIKIIESEDYEKEIEAGQLDAYIQEENIENKINYKIYTSNSNDKSLAVKSKIDEVLLEYKDSIVRGRLENEGLNSDSILNPVSYQNIDLAKTEEKAGYILGQILPFILIMGVLLGAIYPAIDVMAGEKERGTLETLLTLPISNLELIIGKYLSVSFSAILTAILNILSIALTLGFMAYSQDLANAMAIESFDFTKLIGPIIVCIICVCLFAMVVSAISMSICSFAKSFKDAQNYVTPLMLLIMIPSYACMLPTLKLTSTTAVIPVVNISLLIKSVMSFNSDLGLISLVLISNIAFVILSVVALSKIFNSEEVLFGENKSFSFLDKRSNIKKGTMPGPSDGIVLYATALLALIYVGSIVQMKFKMAGIAMTQGMLLLLPLLLAFYIKTDFKKVFSIKLPSIKHVIGSIVLWLGGYIIALLVSQILLYLFPSNQEVVESLNKALFMENSFIVNLIVVALLPAICEEILFRGFIFKSFNKNGKSPKRAIIFSAILFGTMHIDFIRMVPTTILGLVLAYSVYKSGSIFVAMIIHFLNNGLSVVVTHLTNQSNSIEVSQINAISFTHSIQMVLMSIVFLYLGRLLLKDKKDKKDKNI